MPTVIGAIRDKWLALGGASSFLGEPLSDELPTIDGVGRFNRFQGGVIFWSPTTGAFEVHGAILEKWQSLGFERSFLGYPTTDEIEFSEGGRANIFQGGGIYWWADTGPIELKEVVVRYTGLNCFGETDEPSASDEPYAVIGVVSGKGPSSLRTQIYSDVDGGESRPDIVELYRGNPTGIALSVLLNEHDEGDPDKYKEAMKAGVSLAFSGVSALIALIPGAGPIIAGIAGPLLGAASGPVGEELNRVLGTGDDEIGRATLGISAKETVILATRTPTSKERDIPFKRETPLLSGDGGSYKVYFDVTL